MCIRDRAIQRATKLLEKQSDTLTSVMKQKIRELEESKNSFFRYEGLKPVSYTHLDVYKRQTYGCPASPLRNLYPADE